MSVLAYLAAFLLGAALGWTARQYRAHDWLRHGYARMRGGQWYPDRQVCPGCGRRVHVLRVDGLTGRRRCPGCCGRPSWWPWSPQGGTGRVTGGADSPEGATGATALRGNDDTEGDEL